MPGDFEGLGDLKANYKFSCVTGFPALVIAIVLASANTNASHVYGKELYGKDANGQGGDDLWVFVLISYNLAVTICKKKINNMSQIALEKSEVH